MTTTTTTSYNDSDISHYIDNEEMPEYDFTKINLDNIDINPLGNYLFENNLEEKCKFINVQSNKSIYEQVYAIGDVHGDIKAFDTIITNIQFNDTEKCVLKTEIKHKINTSKGTKIQIIIKYEWNKNAKNICIIQVGDIIDGKRHQNIIGNYNNYNNDDLTIISIMIDLKQQAKKYDSDIILLYGNHELMNIFNLIDLKKQSYLNHKEKKFDEKQQIGCDKEDIICKNSLYEFNICLHHNSCKGRFSKYSIPNIDKNKNQIFDRINKLNHLKDKILCNYQPYAIINNYLFCHSGFIFKYIEKILKIYETSTNTGKKSSSLSVSSGEEAELDMSLSSSLSSSDLSSSQQKLSLSNSKLSSSSSYDRVIISQPDDIPLDSSRSLTDTYKFIIDQKESNKLVDIINKTISQIISFLWDIYNKNMIFYNQIVEKTVSDMKNNIYSTDTKLTDEKIKKDAQSIIDNDIKVYKKLIDSIIWSEEFRSIVNKEITTKEIKFNNIDPNENKKLLNTVIENNKKIQIVNESFNFIVKQLQLNGIIMGHIPDYYIRFVNIDGLISPLIYMIDITMSKAFHNKMTKDNKHVYYFRKTYDILKIKKDSQPEIIRILNNNFKDRNDIIYFEDLKDTITPYSKTLNITDKFTEKEIIFSELSDNLKYDLSLQIYNILMNNKNVKENTIIWDNLLILNKENIKQEIIQIFNDNNYIIPVWFKKLSNKSVKELWINNIISYISDIISNCKYDELYNKHKMEKDCKIIEPDKLIEYFKSTKGMNTISSQIFYFIQIYLIYYMNFNLKENYNKFILIENLLKKDEFNVYSTEKLFTNIINYIGINHFFKEQPILEEPNE